MIGSETTEMKIDMELSFRAKSEIKHSENEPAKRRTVLLKSTLQHYARKAPARLPNPPLPTRIESKELIRSVRRVNGQNNRLDTPEKGSNVADRMQHSIADSFLACLVLVLPTLASSTARGHERTDIA